MEGRNEQLYPGNNSKATQKLGKVRANQTGTVTQKLGKGKGTYPKIGYQKLGTSEKRLTQKLGREKENHPSHLRQMVH